MLTINLISLLHLHIISLKVFPKHFMHKFTFVSLKNVSKPEWILLLCGHYDLLAKRHYRQNISMWKELKTMKVFALSIGHTINLMMLCQLSFEVWDIDLQKQPLWFLSENWGKLEGKKTTFFQLFKMSWIWNKHIHNSNYMLLKLMTHQGGHWNAEAYGVLSVNSFVSQDDGSKLRRWVSLLGTHCCKYACITDDWKVLR